MKLKRTESKKYWACLDAKCPVTAITHDGVLKRIKNKYDHPADLEYSMIACEIRT
jgi:hypothetical protein